MSWLCAHVVARALAVMNIRKLAEAQGLVAPPDAEKQVALREGELVLVYRGTEADGEAHNRFASRPYVFAARPDADTNDQRGGEGWVPLGVLRKR